MSTNVDRGPQAGAASPPPPSLRLNGWKEIANRLGKGVRTAQRWEKAYGLPVRRIGRDGGEIVFAFAAELDSWTREMRDRTTGGTDTPRPTPATDARPAECTPASLARVALPPPPARVSTRRRALAALVLSVLVLPALWAAVRGPNGGLPRAVAAHAARIPASWTLERNVLTVRGENGDRLFEHVLDFEAAATPAQPARPGDAPPVEIADLDGDGRNEVLLAAPAIDPAQRRAYCFNADGSLRFVHQPHGSVRFGDTVYADPWAVERVFVTRRPDGSRGLWVASAQPGRFPAWLQELAPDGSVRQQYRTDGRITSVSEARWAGRDVVFVGAADWDQDGASVAIFDRDGVAGSAPASKAGYDCTNCALGGPREFIAFPRLCVTSAGNSIAVADVWVENGDGVTVATAHRRDDRAAPGTPDQLLAYYTFDRSLDLVHAEISREYQATHDALRRQGLLDHSYSPDDDARLFPVRRFDGRRFVTLPAVAVGH